MKPYANGQQIGEAIEYVWEGNTVNHRNLGKPATQDRPLLCDLEVFFKSLDGLFGLNDLLGHSLGLNDELDLVEDLGELACAARGARRPRRR